MMTVMKMKVTINRHTPSKLKDPPCGQQRDALFQKKARSTQGSGRGFWGLRTHHPYPDPLRQDPMCALGHLVIFKSFTQIC